MPERPTVSATKAALVACALGARAGDAGAQATAPAVSSTAPATAAAAVVATAAERAPVLDGEDGDAVWRVAPAITAFRVFDPVEDGEPRLRTEARVAYDARNVYVFVRAYDPRPDSVVALLSRRDVRTPSDQIKVMVDSYHDRRTGYEFAVNPAGVKRDYYTYDDAAEDVTWDAVWDVATRVDSLGWTAEFRLPLSQLRYPRRAGGGGNTFGVMIMRDVARTNERSSWPLLRRSRPGIASQFAPVAGFAGLAAPRRLEVAPYAVARNVSAPAGPNAQPARFGRAQQQSVGADAKVGLGPNLTLDATINPDFGQVEADPAVLNLSAFEQFFEERRPFFVEGAGVFQFGTDPTRLFYSRRVGRAPQLAALATGAPHEVPGATTILGAGKLTGRLGRGTTLGALGAVAGRERAGGTVVEPAAGYGVARLAQDFRGGETGVGAVLTGVRRDLDGGAAERLRRTALAGGVDARHRFADGRFRLTASLAASVVEGEAAAIARTQRSSVHYYQRPDAGLPYDTTRTRLAGTALDLAADELTGTWRSGVSYRRLSPGFESNDLGFLARADLQSANAYLSAVATRPRLFWRNASAEALVTNDFTAGGLPVGRVVELNGFVELARSSAQLSANVWADNVGAVYCDRCARGGPALRLSPAYNVLVNLRRDPRKAVAPYLAAIYTVGDGGRSTLWRVRPLVALRPRSNVNGELGARYQRNRDNTQWYANEGVVGADRARSLFAHLDQHLLSFTARLNVTATPALSLQLYAEPFVTTGRFGDYRALAAPRAAAYDARFAPVARPADGFNEKQLRSNVVVRWEYRPGSALFVVWAQGRDQDGVDAGSFGPARDYRNLFGARPDNTFLIKASYWLGR